MRGNLSVIKQGHTIAVGFHRDGHNYAWGGRFGALHELLRAITDTAHDPEVDFDLEDAAYVTQEVRRTWLQLLPVTDDGQLLWLDHAVSAIANFFEYLKPGKGGKEAA